MKGSRISSPSSAERPDPRVVSITAGQGDLKRKQLKMPRSELRLLQSMQRALEEADEARGRQLGEYNVLRSQPTCARQDSHWDYDPNKVRALRGRKP
jgi:hypothetical protein